MQQIDYEVYDLVIVNAKLFVAAVLFDSQSFIEFSRLPKRSHENGRLRLNVPDCTKAIIKKFANIN